MSVTLNQIVPFGRSLREYELMFRLSETDRQQRILDCGGGPASFNAEMTQLGHTVISIDPIYQFSGPEIEQRFLATVDDVMAQIDATPDDWTWTYHTSSADLRRNRTDAMQRFQKDYELGRAAGRYQQAALPHLPFGDRTFGLALCSHLLFLYSDQLSLDVHLESVVELGRVAAEVRIFPLLTLARQPSPYLDAVRSHLHERGWQTQIESVDYELQKGGNQMLRIIR